MSGLAYVGVDPSAGRDVENRINVEALLNSGVSRTYVQGRVDELAAPYATKVYVDTQDSQFASDSYYPMQDALLVPNTAKGAPNGIASLVGGKIPAAQIPVLGTGIIRGPFPMSHTFTGNTFDTPLKIADWTLGIIGIACQPWVFMVVSVQSTDGRPVIEVKAGAPSQTTYAAQTLVAAGYGRNFYYPATYEAVNTSIAVGHGICNQISTYGEDGVYLSIDQGISSGFSGYDTGYIVAGALTELCPWNWGVAKAAVDKRTGGSLV